MTVARRLAGMARRFLGAGAWTRWGMTFAEALVMIVVAGTLMMPVVGTLQTGVDRTTAYVHQDRMRTIAQASMTEILAGSAYARTPVFDFTATVSWPINDPEPVATYVMEVETLEGITLATLTSTIKGDFAGNEALLGSQPANLKTIVITVTHVPDPGDTGIEPAQVRLFSMVATPRSFNPNRIYIADKDNICLHAIDPFTKSVVETFDLPYDKAFAKSKKENHPYRPGNIAVHPVGGWVLTQRKNSLLLTNVAMFSPNRRSSVEVYSTSTAYLEDPNDNEKIRKDRGVAFRPDGRYCYASSHGPAGCSGLSIYSVPETGNASFSLVRFLPVTTMKYTDLQVGEDGYLYFGDYDYAALCFRRLNMFASQAQVILEDYKLPGWSANAIAACTSRDGRTVYSIWKGPYIASSSSDNPDDWGSALIGWSPAIGVEDIQDLQVSGDNRVLLATSKQGGNKARIYALPTELKGNTINPYGTPNTSAFPGNADITNQAILSPAMNEVWIDRKGAGEIYALDTPGLLSGSYTSSIPTDRTVTFLPSGDAGCVAARMSEMAAVACDGPAKTIEFIDPWSRHHYENLTRKLPYAVTPTHLAFDGSGSRLSVCYNAWSTLPTGIDVFNSDKPSVAIDPESWGVTTDRRPTHHVFSQNGGFLIQKYGTSVAANGYVSFDASGTKKTDMDFPLTASMSDVIPLNDGGALVLLNDVTRKQTRLDRLGPDAKLKASYLSNIDAFPPARATRMAVSADDNLLSFYVPGKPSVTIKEPPVSAIASWSLTFLPQNCIDGKKSTHWNSKSLPRSITFDFGSPVVLKSVKFIGSALGLISPKGRGSPAKFTIKASNDPTFSSGVVTWPSSGNFSGQRVEDWQTFSFSNSASYRYYQLYIIDSYYNLLGNYYAALDEVEWYFSEEAIPDVLQVYDLRANDFGESTQLQGLISEVRNSTSGNFSVSPYITHNSSTISATNRPLIEAFTMYDSLSSQNSYPGNFWDISGYRYRGHAQRFFGYFHPFENDVQTFGGQYCNYFRLFLNGDDIFSAWNTNAGYPFFSVSRPLSNMTFTPIQIDSSDQTNDDILGGVFWSPNESETTPTGSTQDGYAITGMTPGDWKRIPASMTRPLLFAPTCLWGWSDDTPNTNPDRYYLCFSRDVASPTLYVFNAETSKIHAVPFGKPAIPKSLSGKINTNTGRGLAITPDGARLMIPAVTHKQVFLIDVSTPATSTYLNVIGTIDLPHDPVCIAARQFNRIATKKNTFEVVATLTSGIAGCNMAAVASGGIYVLAPNSACNGYVSKKVLQFNPMKNSVTDKGDKLTRAIAAHSVFAYDGELYAYNGAYNTSHSDVHAWVQRWNPNTDTVLSSIDPLPAISPTWIDLPVHPVMTSHSNPSPYLASWSSAYYSDRLGWTLFDGNQSHNTGSGHWTAGGNTNEWVSIDLGEAKTVDKILVYNWADGGTYGVQNFKLQGSHTNTWTGLNTTYWDLVTNTATLSGGAQSFSLASPAAYRYYRILGINTYGATWLVIAEISLTRRVRKVSPVMTDAITPSPYSVTAEAEVSGSGWKLFDGNTTTWWETSGTTNAWVRLDLGQADIVDTVRVMGKGDSLAETTKNFRIEGSSDDLTWVDLSGTLVKPSNGSWDFFSLSNSTAYRYYRFVNESVQSGSQIKCPEVEFYSTQNPPPAGTIPAGVYLSKTVADNGTAEIKRRYAGGTMTPYGYVAGGGFEGTSTCYSNFQVYWPHAIASYTDSNSHFHGLTRDLPPMPTAVGCHALVYHKGYVYRIGGRDAAGALVTGIDRFNFSDNSWSSLGSPAGVDRILPAACSFGDEIFIFGGMTATGGIVNNNLAWNPETNAIRPLAIIPGTGLGSLEADVGFTDRTIGMTAVPCGPAIYLFGGGATHNSGGSGQVLKYTP